MSNEQSRGCCANSAKRCLHNSNLTPATATFPHTHKAIERDVAGKKILLDGVDAMEDSLIDSLTGLLCKFKKFLL